MSDIPWTYSAVLRRHYVYLPDDDQLVFRDGRRMQRPDAMDIDDLEDATYNGDITELDLSQSPPGANATYLAEGRAGPSTYRERVQSVPRTTGNSRQVAEPQDELVSRMARTRIDSSFPRGVLRRNPDNDEEYFTNVNVSTGRNPVLDGPLANFGSLEITSAEVAGMATEKLHPEYKTRRKDFFSVGKIFSILWSEPAGTSANTVATIKEEAVVEGPYGEKIYSKIRRFVVIRAADGYCNALPITTYNGRGVGKRGVTKAEHAVIYTTPLPKPLIMQAEEPKRGEYPMQPYPIRVDPDTRMEKLDPRSRINFGHLHTIQHNVKVKSCGKVADDSREHLLTQFANVFSLSPPAQSSRQVAEASAPQQRAQAPQAGPSRTREDKIQAVLVRMMEQMPRQEAVRNLLANLEEKGMDREDAVELIRDALSQT